MDASANPFVDAFTAVMPGYQAQQGIQYVNMRLQAKEFSVMVGFTKEIKEM